MGLRRPGSVVKLPPMLVSSSGRTAGFQSANRSSILRTSMCRIPSGACSIVPLLCGETTWLTKRKQQTWEWRAHKVPRPTRCCMQVTSETCTHLGIAKSGIASGLGPEDRGFESLYLDSRTVAQLVGAGA